MLVPEDPMADTLELPSERLRVAFIAHDKRKTDLLECARLNRCKLSSHAMSSCHVSHCFNVS